MPDFSNKVVLVTGSSRGIGRATALRFAERGARVAIHYHRNRDAAEQTLKAAGENHLLVQADMGSAESVHKLVERVLDQMGKLDVLVNNAGVHTLHPIPDVDYETWQDEWQKTISANLIGPANLSFLVAKHMMKQGGGRIVNISSRGAFRGEPEALAYGASKAGLNSMSQSMAKALAPHNIFVYVVAPGFVETDMVSDILSGSRGDEIRKQSPLGRVAKPEEVAHTVLFLASEGSEFLTGCIVDVNGASYLRT
ncbi:SDR family oxidoreductase [candidate division KSB1 bacterium]|nr:SDR family oxidoreductase [candidate division KSB1 bacterium]NIR69583.1 SDR family oxidoreductase [candidate division KSB1 bacterium]NIS25931.1 SDR family oxidoreductase [candidate division KSB1 bacterium]NIT72812.1 SDR family oxidoreductase [candidate division KSB1 bacterium]NIU26619.1 SDR family oxidoreductase [candidate division KSB1 bacterium]